MLNYIFYVCIHLGRTTAPFYNIYLYVYLIKIIKIKFN